MANPENQSTDRKKTNRWRGVLGAVLLLAIAVFLPLLTISPEVWADVNERCETLLVGDTGQIKTLIVGGDPRNGTAGTTITEASLAEMNSLDGLTATPTELNYLDGTTPGTVVASKALAVGADKNLDTLAIADGGLSLGSGAGTAVTATAAELNVLDGVTATMAELNYLDGTVKTSTAAITGYAATADGAGQDVYCETEDAGATATAARVGGLLYQKTGDGSAGAAAVIAGAGGAMSHVTGAGGAASGTAAGGAGGAYTDQAGVGGAHTGGGATGAGGAGGANSLIAGAGGATSNVGSDNGGAGGDVAITAGVGGLASAGTGDGGAGGTITLTPGGIGTSAGGIDGNPGKVQIGAGLVHYTPAQVIAMGDNPLTLTLVDGTPTGTLLTSNILSVDAESSGTENLLLPPEADCNGVVLWIRNTGGESIVLQDDAAGTIATIATAESAYAFCDGVAWQALNFS